MKEEMGEWKLHLVFLLAIVTVTAAARCPQDSPDRNLLCYQTRLTEEELDPCLCTHWVLTRDLLDEKDYLLDRNDNLQIILSMETGDSISPQEISHEGVQGIELGTLWTKSPKQLVKYVKTIAGELRESGRDFRSKRSADQSEESSTGDEDLTTVVTDSMELMKSTVPDSMTSTDTTLTLEAADSGDRNSREEVEPKPILIMRLPSDAMFLAKHYDLKSLARYVDLFVVNTHNIVESRANVTYHPSRLMGINDIHNADSLVDLISGLGIPKEKLVLSFPSHAYQFQLANASLTLPQSPALGAPKILSPAQMCKLTKKGNWTTERDEDLTAPYTFQNNTWIAFDDEMSASIKSKYIALSNLAGAAVMDIQDQDWSHVCGGEKGLAPALVRTLYQTFTQVIRKPRQTQLLELQQELHEHSVDAPTRVVRVVDHEGATHVVRRQAVVNFECSRQGYFVHPTGCNRFYRCVKFNQYTDDWTVFEYDCPAGLAFDERWEVCVWPGSLPNGAACQGSSEIAPVPRARFQCPAQPGYYADPENCRWFFACLDHAGDGVTPLTAYEFRCPFSLVFNEKTLVCDWPWNVQGCGSQGVGGARFTYGDLLEGRHKPSYATVPDYLVSGGRIENTGGAGGAILGTYYGSNGLLDINAAGGYSGSLNYGNNAYTGSTGGSSTAEQGSYTAGSNQYGNYANLDVYGRKTGGSYVAGSEGYGQSKGYAGSSGASYVQNGAGAYAQGNAGAYIAGNEGAYVHGQYPGDSGDDGSYRDGKYANGGQYVDGKYANGGQYVDGKYANGGQYVDGKYANGGQYVDGKYANGGQYVDGKYANGGQYVDGKYENAGQYVDGKYTNGGQYVDGKYANGGQYVDGKYANGGQYVPSAGGYGYKEGSEGSYSSAGKYTGSSGKYAGGKYVGSSVSGSSYSGDNGQYVAGQESQYSGSQEGGAFSSSSGAYSAKGKSKYYGAAAGINGGVPSSTPYAEFAGQYDGGKYSIGSGGYSTGGQYSGAKQYTPVPVVSTTAAPFVTERQHSGSGQYKGAKQYSTVPAVSTTPAPFLTGELFSSSGEYNGAGQYSGAKQYTPVPVVSTTATPFLAGGQYSGSGEYNGAGYSSSTQYSGAKQYTPVPVVSTPATPFLAGQYSTSSQQYSGKQYSGSPFTSTVSPFLSTQAGQYALSNGLTYSGPSVAPAFDKSVEQYSFGSTPGSIATGSTYGGASVGSTTSGYSGLGGAYSGVSLSGERFGVNGESGHIHSPASNVYANFDQYTGGFGDLALRVNALQPSLSENVDGTGYSTSGNVFSSPSTTPGGFSSYPSSSYSTPNPFYGSSTSLPGVFSSIYPGKSYVSTTPALVQYSSLSPAKSTYYTTAPENIASYTTPKPASYSGASYSSTPAPYSPSVVKHSPTPAPYSPSVVNYSPTPAPYSPYVVKNSPTPVPYSPSVGAYSTTPAPYSPSVGAYSSTPVPYSPSVGVYSPTSAPYSPSVGAYSPTLAPNSPSVGAYSPTSAPYSPSFGSYSPTSGPYSPSVGAYSPTSAPYSPSVGAYSPTPAPYSPSIGSYSPTSAPYSPSVGAYSPNPAPYSPSIGSYSPTPASYSPSVSPYSPTPALYAPSVVSFSTPAPYSPKPVSLSGSYSSKSGSSYSSSSSSYSPSVGPAFPSYSTPQPVAYTPGPSVYTPTSTVAPAVISYSTPAPKTYYPTSTPAPVVRYTPAPLYGGSLTGFSGHSQYRGQAQYSAPSFGQGYVSGESKQYAQSGYSADNAAVYNAGAGKIQYGTKLPASYSTTEKGSYASSTSAPVVYSTTATPVNTYSTASNINSAGGKYLSGQNYVKSNSGYERQSFAGEEYLPPLESVSSYDVKKPCDHAVPANPSQTFFSTGYEQTRIQAPYVFDSSSPAPSYNPQSFYANPIIVQPLPEVSSFKDYFYSTVLPSSYSTPAPFAYSTTPAYYSSVSPIQYSTPSFVSSTPAPPTAEYQYVSSYSTPKPIVSTTASPIYESSYVSSYSTPKAVPYSPSVVSTTSRPIVDYSFGSSYSPKPVSYSPTPIVSTTAAPIVYSTSVKPVTYTATFESSKVYPPGPSIPQSYSSYSSPPVVYGPGNLQPIKSYQSTGSYDVQSYTVTPKPCATNNALDIADQSKASASNLPDGTYVVGIKHQDKVVIVSRLSDFNPLLVEKLGATCDCHSQSQPIKVVRRRKILKSTTASPSDGSSGQYNSNFIQSYSAHKLETGSPSVDVVSYNTQEEADKSEQFHASVKTTPKKLYSARKSAVTSTTETSYDDSEEHSHDGDNLSITEFGTIECKRAGLFRHPKHCNKFYQCNWDEWKKKYALHEFKCPIHLAYDNSIGACNWPSKGPACSNDNLLV